MPSGCRKAAAGGTNHYCFWTAVAGPSILRYTFWLRHWFSRLHWQREINLHTLGSIFVMLFLNSSILSEPTCLPHVSLQISNFIKIRHEELIENEIWKLLLTKSFFLNVLWKLPQVLGQKWVAVTQYKKQSTTATFGQWPEMVGDLRSDALVRLWYHPTHRLRRCQFWTSKVKNIRLCKWITTTTSLYLAKLHKKYIVIVILKAHIALK